MEESGAPQGHDGATAAHRASAEGASGPPDPPLEHILLGLVPPPGGRYRRPALDLLRRLLALIALNGGLSALVVAALHAHRRLSEPEHLRAVILAILIGTALAGAKLWVRRARLEGPWQTTGAGWIGALAVVAFLWPLGRLSDARDSFVATGWRPPIIWAMWLTVLGILLIAPYPWPRLAPRPGWARWVAVVVVAALTIPASAVLMGRALTLGSGLPTTAQTNVGQGWLTAERDGQGQWRIDAEDGIQTMVGTSAGALILERQDAETEDMHLTLIDPEGEPVWRRTIPPKAPDCVYQDEGLACGLTVDATGRRVAVLYGYEGDDLGGPPGGIGLAVLDTATGRLLWSRTLEDELVVSVALTAGHLALQTIRGDQLVGSTLSVYSLGGEDPYDGEPLWSRSESRSLLTASSTQLVLAPVDGGGIDPSFERADLVDALTGEAVGGIDEVEVRGGRGSVGHEVPPGWVARCTASCPRQDDSGRPGIELVSLDSGAVVDIGADGSRLGATTSGWLLSRGPRRAAEEAPPCAISSTAIRSRATSRPREVSEMRMARMRVDPAPSHDTRGRVLALTAQAVRDGAVLASLYFAYRITALDADGRGPGVFRGGDAAIAPGWVVLSLLGVLVIVMALRTMQRYVARLPVALSLLAGAAACGYGLERWWDDSPSEAPSDHLNLTLVTLALSLSLAVSMDLIKRLLQAPEASTSEHDGRAARAARLQRALRGARQYWWAPALSGVAVGMVGILVLSGAVGYVSSRFDPAGHVTVQPQGRAPGVPDSLTGEVAWTTVVEDAHLQRLYRGSDGAVLITASTARGISARDGATTWQYSLPVRIRESAISPDGAHVALIYDDVILDSEDGPPAIVILDTATGQVVWERRAREGEPVAVQMTDSVALVGSEGISLEDGRRLWRLEDHVAQGPALDESADSHEPVLGSFSAGHSTLVLARQCRGEAGLPVSVCSLTLADDSDPSRTRTLEGVVVEDGNAQRPTLVEGWTVRRTQEDPEALEAVSIDTGETVPVGTYLAADSVASDSRLVLYTRGEPRPQDCGQRSGQAEDAYVDERIGAVLDIATGELTEVAGPPVFDDGGERLDTTGWMTRDTGQIRVSEDASQRTVEITRVDGGDPIVLSPQRSMRGYFPDTPTYGSSSPERAAVAAPGVAVVAQWVNDPLVDSGIILFGVR